MESNTVSVERTINAAPEKIFELLSDAGNHQSFDGSGTVRGTKTESQPLAIGTTFGMSMKQGIGYTTSNTVIEFEKNKQIAWQTKGFGGFVGGRIWRYELEPAGGGTLVRETWDVSQDKQRFLLKRSKMPAATEKNMTHTLDRIAEVVEG